MHRKPKLSFEDVIEQRRSTRKFEPGREVDRPILDRIVTCGRWAPSGANVQCWDFIVIDEPDTREAVRQVFLRQAQRFVDHAKGFPAVAKNYLSNTVAIILVLGDPRWKVCFPQPTSQGWEREYLDNNEAIFLCSLGAAIQNIQLGVTAEGLTSAWLSGGGEDLTNKELSDLLGYPSWMKAYGTIPIGYPQASQDRRYRRPLEQVRHWNGYQAEQYRPHAQVDFYESTLRPFAMYRDQKFCGIGRIMRKNWGVGPKPSPPAARIRKGGWKKKPISLHQERRGGRQRRAIAADACSKHPICGSPTPNTDREQT